MRSKQLLLWAFPVTFLSIQCHAFLTPAALSKPSSTNSALFGAFDKRNKQRDLIKKMEEAKRQREMVEGGDSASGTSFGTAESSTIRKSDEDVKKENDMKRFEQLLNNEAVTYDIDGKSDNYMTKKQEEEEMDAGYMKCEYIHENYLSKFLTAYRMIGPQFTIGLKKKIVKGVDRIFEGDPAKEHPFQDLVRIENGNALGEEGAKRLLPWLNKNSAKHKDYLVILSDPRPKSTELRSTYRSLIKLSPDILEKLIIINSDTPAENRRYLKKQGTGIASLNVFCDEKMEWMRNYTALGTKRWSMCMFIVADGRVQKLVRELDVDLVSSVIQNAVKSLNT